MIKLISIVLSFTIFITSLTPSLLQAQELSAGQRARAAAAARAARDNRIAEASRRIEEGLALEAEGQTMTSSAHNARASLGEVSSVVDGHLAMERDRVALGVIMQGGVQVREGVQARGDYGHEGYLTVLEAENLRKELMSDSGARGNSEGDLYKAFKKEYLKQLEKEYEKGLLDLEASYREGLADLDREYESSLDAEGVARAWGEARGEWEARLKEEVEELANGEEAYNGYREAYLGNLEEEYKRVIAGQPADVIRGVTVEYIRLRKPEAVLSSWRGGGKARWAAAMYDENVVDLEGQYGEAYAEAMGKWLAQSREAQAGDLAEAKAAWLGVYREQQAEEVIKGLWESEYKAKYLAAQAGADEEAYEEARRYIVDLGLRIKALWEKERWTKWGKKYVLPLLQTDLVMYATLGEGFTGAGVKEFTLSELRGQLASHKGECRDVEEERGWLNNVGYGIGNWVEENLGGRLVVEARDMMGRGLGDQERAARRRMSGCQVALESVPGVVALGGREDGKAIEEMMEAGYRSGMGLSVLEVGVSGLLALGAGGRVAGVMQEIAKQSEKDAGDGSVLSLRDWTLAVQETSDMLGQGFGGGVQGSGIYSKGYEWSFYKQEGTEALGNSLTDIGMMLGKESSRGSSAAKMALDAIAHQTLVVYGDGLRVDFKPFWVGALAGGYKVTADLAQVGQVMDNRGTRYVDERGAWASVVEKAAELGTDLTGWAALSLYRSGNVDTDAYTMRAARNLLVPVLNKHISGGRFSVRAPTAGEIRAAERRAAWRKGMGVLDTAIMVWCLASIAVAIGAGAVKGASGIVRSFRLARRMAGSGARLSKTMALYKRVVRLGRISKYGSVELSTLGGRLRARAGDLGRNLGFEGEGLQMVRAYNAQIRNAEMLNNAMVRMQGRMLANQAEAARIAQMARVRGVGNTAVVEFGQRGRLAQAGAEVKEAADAVRSGSKGVKLEGTTRSHVYEPSGRGEPLAGPAYEGPMPRLYERVVDHVESDGRVVETMRKIGPKEGVAVGPIKAPTGVRLASKWQSFKEGVRDVFVWKRAGVENMLQGSSWLVKTRKGIATTLLSGWLTVGAPTAGLVDALAVAREGRAAVELVEGARTATIGVKAAEGVRSVTATTQAVRSAAKASQTVRGAVSAGARSVSGEAVFEAWAQNQLAAAVGGAGQGVIRAAGFEGLSGLSRLAMFTVPAVATPDEMRRFGTQLFNQQNNVGFNIVENALTLQWARSPVVKVNGHYQLQSPVTVKTLEKLVYNRFDRVDEPVGQRLVLNPLLKVFSPVIEISEAVAYQRNANLASYFKAVEEANEGIDFAAYGGVEGYFKAAREQQAAAQATAKAAQANAKTAVFVNGKINQPGLRAWTKTLPMTSGIAAAGLGANWVAKGNFRSAVRKAVEQAVQEAEIVFSTLPAAEQTVAQKQALLKEALADKLASDTTLTEQEKQTTQASFAKLIEAEGQNILKPTELTSSTVVASSRKTIQRILTQSRKKALADFADTYSDADEAVRKDPRFMSIWRQEAAKKLRKSKLPSGVKKRVMRSLYISTTQYTPKATAGKKTSAGQVPVYNLKHEYITSWNLGKQAPVLKLHQEAYIEWDSEKDKAKLYVLDHSKLKDGKPRRTLVREDIPVSAVKKSVKTSSFGLRKVAEGLLTVNNRIWPMFGIYLLAGMGNVSSTISTFSKATFNLSGFELFMMGGLSSISMGVLSLLAGIWQNRWSHDKDGRVNGKRGRLISMNIGLGLYILSFALPMLGGMAFHVGDPMLAYKKTLLIASFLLMGAGAAFLDVSMKPTVMAATPSEDYQARQGYLSVFKQTVGNVSNYVVPPLAMMVTGWLGNVCDWTIYFPIYTVIAVGVMATYNIFTMHQQSLEEQEFIPKKARLSLRNIVKEVTGEKAYNRIIRHGVLATALHGANMGILGLFINNLFREHYSTLQTVTSSDWLMHSFAAFTIPIIAGRLVGTYLMKHEVKIGKKTMPKLNNGALLQASTVAVGISLVGLVWGTWPIKVAAVVLAALGLTNISPILNGYTTHQTRQVSDAVSALLSATSLASFLINLAFGHLIDITGTAVAFLLPVGMLTYLFFFGRDIREHRLERERQTSIRDQIRNFIKKHPLVIWTGALLTGCGVGLALGGLFGTGATALLMSAIPFVVRPLREDEMPSSIDLSRVTRATMRDENHLVWRLLDEDRYEIVGYAKDGTEDEYFHTREFDVTNRQLAKRFNLLNIVYPKIIANGLGRLPSNIQFNIEQSQRVVASSGHIRDVEERAQMFFILSAIDIQGLTLRQAMGRPELIVAMLRGKSLSLAERDQLLSYWLALKEAGFTHGDLMNNLYLARGEDGRLQVIVLDFEIEHENEDLDVLQGWFRELLRAGMLDYEPGEFTREDLEPGYGY